MTQAIYPIQIFLNSRGQGEDLFALGADDLLIIHKNEVQVWERIQTFIDTHAGRHVFFAFSYELKDHVERLASNNSAFIECPIALLFTSPNVFRTINGKRKAIEKSSLVASSRASEYLDSITTIPSKPNTPSLLSLDSLSKEAYLRQIEKVKDHIQQGDIYELNFCQEFRQDQIHLDPIPTYFDLLSRTNAPYSSYLKYENLHLMCASPENYLEKEAQIVSSRPIKGTRKRVKDQDLDDQIKQELAADPKERAENVMITDLVRNDLSRIAIANSVQVAELCKVYSYDTVHQMISTVQCKVPRDMALTELFKASFPMGSMTGAPKVRAMELIDTFEDFKRGWFSGTLGYISPNGDMKSNVVIRSILYDDLNKRASISAGGAITSLSDPDAEYDECLLKASVLKNVLSEHAQKVSPQVEREC